MCTLTYLLTHSGYELFFNRDEQRTRAIAIAPLLNSQRNAIYPIDPVGQGSWLAVHKSGLCLALLNLYQGQQTAVEAPVLSRGKIILNLLNNTDDVISALKNMPLKQYPAFQLCVFAKDLCKSNNRVRTFQWDGQHLEEVGSELPITSSSVDFDKVYAHRRQRFFTQVDSVNPTREEFFSYHRSQLVQGAQVTQEPLGKLSVKMCRADALTVSLSHIVVDKKIVFTYFDYIKAHQASVTSTRTV